jgi:hypothetical protein
MCVNAEVWKSCVFFKGNVDSCAKEAGFFSASDRESDGPGQVCRRRRDNADGSRAPQK